jgi:Flp pilus assembly protein TadG
MVLFTAMLPTVLIPLVGLAIDASIGYIVQAKLSGAVDGAALGAGRLLGTNADTVEIAGEFLNANFPTGFWGSSNLTPNITYTKTFIAHTISVSATVDVPLLFMRIFGYDHSTVAASAVATRKEARVELVLDRSGSMSSEMTLLKFKAAEFVGKFISGYDELGLVAFATSGVVGYPTTRPYNYSPTSSGGPDTNFEITQTNGDMLDMINDIQSNSNGRTNMSEALALAYLELQKADHRDNDPTRLNAIVLFTDGVPNTLSVYANDPSDNSLKSTSPCTYNPATAGVASTQMIGIAEGDSSTSGGLYFLASSDSNSAASWMKYLISNETIGTGNLKTAVTNCTYLSKTTPSLGDLKQVPSKDYWGDSTNDGTAYKSSPMYKSYTYDSNKPTVGSNIAIASWNATDNTAQRILADTNLNVTIYVIGYTPNGGVDEYLLKRLANTKDSSNHNSAWQTGMYVAADDDAALEVAFQTVASAILRLAR